MSAQTLKNQKIWFDGYNLTGISNALNWDCSLETADATVLGDDTRVNKPGLKVAAAGIAGFFDSDPYDKALFESLSASGKVLSFGISGTEGDPVYSMQCLIGSYKPEGSNGEMFRFSLDAACAGRAIRGTLMENNSAAVTSSQGTARQLGAVSATQKLYAALHVIGTDGTDPTIDIEIESDNDSGFASATSRISFTQFDDVGSEWKELSGAITDDWWRVKWTLGGTDPSFDFIVILAIA